VPDGPLKTDREAREAWIRALQETAPIAEHRTLTLPRAIEQRAVAAPDSVALLGDNEALTYRDFAARMRAYSDWAVRHRIGRGDVVGLLMRNCPEYLAIWLGITRVGGVVALLNTNQTGDGLVHAIDIVAPTHLIVGAGLGEAFDTARRHLRSAPATWIHGADHSGARRIDHEIDEHLPPDDSAVGYPAPTIADRALCIYTSGTTGLPKAANVSHFRLIQWSRWFAGMVDAQPSDRMYNCLPMYHSVGGVVATGMMLVSGGSVVIRNGFSASCFWDDVAASECTVFQYIGELCRYLVNTPPHPRERAHRLRLSCGNGLRADVWAEFRNRFAIPRNLEFYAATEANFSLYNCENEPGSIGRIPPFLAHRFPVALVQYDVETGEPVRNEAGRCMRCAPDEAGEAISRIADRAANNGSPFEGYTDRAASDEKILRDVFEPGDAWFRSGDLMRKDARGFYYFVDRIGDTFRWRGENVSTDEVAQAINACSGVAEAVVYGVAVPGADGRAGMAAIVAGAGFDLAVLRRHLATALPEYARPVFLRVRPALDTTETFKQKKQHLAGEGFDPALTGGDPIYFDDRVSRTFLPVDVAVHRRILAGEVRL
jgi:fatty-acyl-CoA synthase